MTRFLAMILCACVLAVPACGGDKPNELLQTAELEERQMNLPHARQLYEDVIRLYPTSTEAETARARLASLTPVQ